MERDPGYAAELLARKGEQIDALRAALEAVIPLADAHARRLLIEHQSDEFSAGAQKAARIVEDARATLAKP